MSLKNLAGILAVLTALWCVDVNLYAKPESASSKNNEAKAEAHEASERGKGESEHNGYEQREKKDQQTQTRNTEKTKEHDANNLKNRRQADNPLATPGGNDGNGGGPVMSQSFAGEQ